MDILTESSNRADMECRIIEKKCLDPSVMTSAAGGGRRPHKPQNPKTPKPHEERLVGNYNFLIFYNNGVLLQKTEGGGRGEGVGRGESPYQSEPALD